MSGANKPAMKRIGYFGEPGYIGIGDPFKTKQPIGQKIKCFACSVLKLTYTDLDMDRYKNAQFQTNPTFKQKYNLGNGLFSKAPALYNVIARICFDSSI